MTNSQQRPGLALPMRERIQACPVIGLTHLILFPIGAPKNAAGELPRTMRELADA